MAQAGLSLTRRAAFAAAALASAVPLPGAASAPADSPLLALHRDRLAVQEHIDALDMESDSYEEIIARLCAAQDELPVRMTELPVETVAGARAELTVVEQLYHDPMHANGFDKELFEQVLQWMDTQPAGSV